MVATAGKA